MRSMKLCQHEVEIEKGVRVPDNAIRRLDRELGVFDPEEDDPEQRRVQAPWLEKFSR